MLKLPAFKQYQFPTGESVTVFQDDAQFWRFYAIPGFPTVRFDANDNPVFMLIKYKFSDQSREDDPNMPRGGGYMVFDCELKISEAHREEIIEDLQAHVEAHWEELKRMPDDRVRSLTMGATFQDTIGPHWAEESMAGGAMASGNTGSTTTLNIPGTGFTPPPKDAEAPTVVIGEPLWLDGKVTMTAPQSEHLVQNKVGERKASLLGNNVAAFSIDLTSDGATFMQKTLVAPDGSGATDLTPIQVAYELTMMAKLPPASMYVKFSTAEVYHAVQELFHEHNNCSDDYFTSENMMSTAIEAGLITVKIDMGGVTDEDLQQMLTQQAMDMVQQLLADRFAEKDNEPLEEWADSDLAESSKEVYRLKRVSEVDMTDFEQTMEIQTATEFTIAPQGTLQAFFRDQDDMSPFVREVDLDDDFFKTLGLKARAFANWEEDDIAFVELEVKYEHDGELKTNTFTFTPGEIEPQEWDPSLIDGEREYEYRWRVAFEGREPEEWSRWEDATTRDLNVSVETPGKIDVEVTGVGLDFQNVLDAVLVHLRYADRSNDVEMAGQSVLLAADRPSGHWTRNLYAPFEEPIEYRTDYLLKNGSTIEGDWERTDGPTQNVVVTRPEVDVLDIPLVPAGDWTDAIQAVASLRYEDGDYHRDVQFNFKSNDEFKKWAVLLLDPEKREFDYRVLATFRNGDVQETDWMTREGDQAVPVELAGPPRLGVKVSGQVLDYASTPLAQVDLEYRDPEGPSDVESFALQSSQDVKSWSVRLREGGPRTYRRRVTYFPAEGDPVPREWESTEAELFVVPRYSIPKVGGEFNPVLQDFGATPAIEVQLSYDDPQRSVHERRTLVFTSNEKQLWVVPVADEAPRAYQMTVTWHHAEGGQSSVGPLTLEKTAVLLPRAPRPEEG